MKYEIKEGVLIGLGVSVGLIGMAVVIGVSFRILNWFLEPIFM